MTIGSIGTKSFCKNKRAAKRINKKQQMINKIVFVFVLTMICNYLTGQSPFNFEEISKEKDVVQIEYDGKLSFLADSEVVRLKPYKFISIGNLRTASAISNGSIYNKLIYNKKQTVIIKSVSNNFTPKIKQWTPIEADSVLPFDLDVKLANKSKKRRSFFIQLEECEIYLINIKEEEIELFKWMLNSIKFI